MNGALRTEWIDTKHVSKQRERWLKRYYVGMAEMKQKKLKERDEV